MSLEPLHKNVEGAYVVQYFDRYGRHLKQLEETCINYLVSIDTGKANLKGEATSFIVRRTLYNSVDHK